MVNGRNAITRGGEISIHYDVNRRGRLVASYSGAFLTLGLPPGFSTDTLLDVAPYYPRHMAQVRSSWDLGRRWMLDAEAYRTGALHEAGRAVLAGFTRVDFRIERKLGERSGIYLNGQNLLHASQQEFFGNNLYVPGRISRSIAVGFRWER